MWGKRRRWREEAKGARTKTGAGTAAHSLRRPRFCAGALVAAPPQPSLLPALSLHPALSMAFKLLLPPPHTPRPTGALQIPPPRPPILPAWLWQLVCEPGCGISAQLLRLGPSLDYKRRLQLSCPELQVRWETAKPAGSVLQVAPTQLRQTKRFTTISSAPHFSESASRVPN